MTHPAFCQLNLLSKEILLLLLIFLSVKSFYNACFHFRNRVYAQQTIESINEYTIQKGLAYCHLLENHMQAIRFTYFIQQEEVDESEKNESSVGDALQLETVYLLHGKFTYLINEDSLDMIIISHVQLPIAISDCPASSLIPRFIGKTITSPSYILIT